MNANQYFSAIAENPTLKNMLGEIAVKTNGPYLNPAMTLHISVATSTKQGVLMYVDSAGKYIRLASSEVKSFLDRYRKPLAIAAGGLGILTAAAFAVWMFLKSRRRT
jgi:hypothetical protein